MARGITENEVWKACDALLLEGARPTIERVRQKLGRGSPNTVSPMLETWFKHLGGRIKDPGAFSAPATVAEPVLQAAQHFWEVAQAEARRDLDDRVREGLAAAAANVEAEKERATIAESAAFSANSKATHLQAELDRLRDLLEAERLAHAATAATLAAAREQVEDLGSRLRAVEQDHAARQSALTDIVKAAQARADASEKRAALQLDANRQEVLKAEKRSAQLEQKLRTTNTEFADYRNQIEDTKRKLQTELEQVRLKLQQSERAQADLDQRAQNLAMALSASEMATAEARAQATLSERLLAARIKPPTGAAKAASKVVARPGK